MNTQFTPTNHSADWHQRRSLRLFGLLGLFGALVSLLVATSLQAEEKPNDHTLQKPQKRTLHVNCDKNQTLSRALKRARSGTRIVFQGVCNEQILIKTDHIRLQGVDGAVIDGNTGHALHEGTVTIRGAQGVRLSNLTVRNGPDQGIVVQGQASVALKNIETHGNATVGVTIDASYAELKNVRSFDNGSGFDFFTGATVIARGPLVATSNRGAGVQINAKSTLELRGAIVTTEFNGGDGVTLVNDSHLVILSFPESVGSGVVATGNGGAAGLFVANSSISSVGSQNAGSGSNVFSVTKHGVGMLFISSNLASPFGTARFEVAQNGIGVLFADNSDATVVGGLHVRSNHIGVLGDGAGVLRLRQSALNPSEISGNAEEDVLMTFGSRIEIGADVAGSMTCDPTVLTPGGPCP